LREAIETETGSRGHTAVALIDLNDFKKLNDVYGHHAGDRVLQSVARSLEASLGTAGTVARLGGDEFLLILYGVAGIADANLRVERALSACRAGAIIDGHAYAVESAAGISFSSADTSDPEALIRQADRAMYVAKRNGISQAVFTREMLSHAELQTVDIARELAAAVADGLLFVAYQPEVDLRDGRIVAVEALARWNHPRLGDISPEVFIRLAEATDQICAIGDFVLKTALRDGKRWQRPGHPVRVSINFSPRQLERPGFVGETLQAIARTGFDRNLVDIEIAERFVVGASRETVVSLQALRAAGPHIVVDDLGSGRVNLTLLRDFPLDVLKLDRSFSAPLGTESEYASRAVIAGLVTMAGLLHVRIVAEGVDLLAQLRAVRELHCDGAQGDLIVSAISAEQVERLLAQDRSLLPEGIERG
jgi:diguanylate cyclase (GGDEF)-like protein